MPNFAPLLSGVATFRRWGGGSTAPGFADHEADDINIKLGEIKHLDLAMENT